MALHRGAEPRMPQLLSGLGVEGVENAVEIRRQIRCFRRLTLPR